MRPYAPIASCKRALGNGARAISVHPVVLDQEVALQELERRARLERRRQILGATRRAKARVQHRRAQALAAALRQVGHRFDQLFGARRDGPRQAQLCIEIRAQIRVDRRDELTERRAADNRHGCPS
jgi:hypothetical protein